MSEAARELVRAAEAAELAATESAYQAVPAGFANAMRMGCQRHGAVLVVHAAAFDVLMHNRILGLGVADAADVGLVDEAEALYRALGAKRFMIPVVPDPDPASLTELLAARGFYRHNHWIRLARATDDVPPATSDLRVATLGAASAEAFGRLEAEAFGHPPQVAAWNAAVVGRADWTFFGAFDGDALAAVAGMHVQGAAAWFGYAATRAAFRGRGAQSALIAARLALARDLGCRWCVVETAADTPEKPNPSTRNLRRLGFRDAYERPNWVKVM